MVNHPAADKVAIVPRLIDAEAAASFCGVSRAHWMALHAGGHVPLPIHLGRRRLWSIVDLENWIAAACPDRADWEASKLARR